LGNLRQLEKLVSELGLIANTIFGYGRGIENIDKIPEEINAHYITISWPVFESLIINGPYVGYSGGLKLLEDIYSVVLTRFN